VSFKFLLIFFAKIIQFFAGLELAKPLLNTFAFFGHTLVQEKHTLILPYVKPKGDHRFNQIASRNHRG
jgi:hypothetical protein